MSDFNDAVSMTATVMHMSEGAVYERLARNDPDPRIQRLRVLADVRERYERVRRANSIGGVQLAEPSSDVPTGKNDAERELIRLARARAERKGVPFAVALLEVSGEKPRLYDLARKRTTTTTRRGHFDPRTRHTTVSEG